MATSDRLNAADYLVLFAADLKLNGAVARVLNKNGAANWTVCPSCGVDDWLICRRT